jgi:hypothetical protein
MEYFQPLPFLNPPQYHLNLSQFTGERYAHKCVSGHVKEIFWVCHAQRWRRMHLDGQVQRV